MCFIVHVKYQKKFLLNTKSSYLISKFVKWNYKFYLEIVHMFPLKCM